MDRKEWNDLKRTNSKVNIDSIVGTSAVWSIDSASVKIPLAVIDSIDNKSDQKRRKRNGVKVTKPDVNSIAEYDSMQNALPEKARDSWLERKIKMREIELNQKYKGKSNQLGRDFVEGFSNNFSKVLFWLLPVFALLLKLLYLRRDYYYSEHLVFSIYYYNFFYLAGSIQMLVSEIAWLEWLGIVIGFWIFFYLLFAFKRMYQQSWKKTIFKFVLFSFAFALCLAIAMSISAFVIFMMI